MGEIVYIKIIELGSFWETIRAFRKKIKYWGSSVNWINQQLAIKARAPLCSIEGDSSPTAKRQVRPRTTIRIYYSSSRSPEKAEFLATESLLCQGQDSDWKKDLKIWNGKSSNTMNYHVLWTLWNHRNDPLLPGRIQHFPSSILKDAVEASAFPRQHGSPQNIPQPLFLVT